MSTLPSDAPSWLVLAVAIIVVAGYAVKFLSEASESFAKILGPIGRWLRARGEYRALERIDTDPRRVSAIEADRDFHEAESARYAARAAAAEATTSAFMDWYSQCDQPFHTAVRISAAESGCDLPPWTPFSQWKPPTDEPGEPRTLG